MNVKVFVNNIDSTEICRMFPDIDIIKIEDNFEKYIIICDFKSNRFKYINSGDIISITINTIFQYLYS